MRRAPLVTAVLVLLFAGFGVYWNSLHGEFVFDDQHSILDNPDLRSFWPLSRSLTGPDGSCQSGRPVSALSLALNYSLGGYEVVGYHLFNVFVHLAAGLALLGLVRRTLLHTALAPRALPLAFAVALLWVLHPLHTDALNHISYRNETLMALFYLLTLYGAERGFSAERGRGWLALSIACCFLAMGSKEVAVSAPLLVLVYDRQFFTGDFRAALRERRGYYLSLASSWVLLVLCVWWADRGKTVGFDHLRVGSMDYLRTQMEALMLYLRLPFWPHPLTFDYFDWPPVRSWGEVWLETSIVALLFATTLFGVLKRRAWSVPALGFFAVLSPTTSFIPVTGEIVAEHRLVLPLAAVVILVVLAASRLGAKLPEGSRAAVGWTLLIAAALALGATTVARNRVYRSAEDVWRDTIAKRPENVRAYNYLLPFAMNRGDLEEAEALLRRSAELRPRNARTWNSLGTLLTEAQRFREAEEAFERALEVRADQPVTHLNLGQLYLRTNRPGEAARAFREALRLEPTNPAASRALAWILATSTDVELRDGAEALRLARALCAGPTPPPGRLEVLAAALAEAGDFPEAVRVSEQAATAAERTGDRELASRIRSRQRTYSSSRPHRE